MPFSVEHDVRMQFDPNLTAYGSFWAGKPRKTQFLAFSMGVTGDMDWNIRGMMGNSTKIYNMECT